MFTYIIKRLKKGGIGTLGALFFAALMTFSLCGLSAASEAEIRKYEDAYNTLEVKMTVTSLTGIRRDGLALPSWVINAFTDPSVKDLFRDLEVKMTVTAGSNGITSANMGLGATDDAEFALGVQMLIGLISPELDRDLGEDGVTYYSGHDASTFRVEADNTYISGSGGEQREELYVVVPIEVYEKGCAAVTMTFSYDDSFDSYPRSTVTREFHVMGTHTLGEGIYYCPYNTLVRICKDIGMPRYVDSLTVTVADNHKLDKIKSYTEQWFTKPSLTAERIPWNYSYDHDYPFALDIDDTALVRAGEVMKTNIMINKIGTALVFILSAGAGFLVGFLTVNRRKKEIMLMRTLGMPDRSVFANLFIEQGLCSLAGALFGGVFFLWQPPLRIVLFLALNCAGLALSLVVFLKKNLLTAIKED